MTSEAVAHRQIPNIAAVMTNHTAGHSFKILRVEMLPLVASHADRLLSKARVVKESGNFFFYNRKDPILLSYKELRDSIDIL